MRLGIDFGTSFSLAGTCHLGNKDILLPGGVYGIPSVFYYDDFENDILIGQEALDAAQGECARNLVREIKMGLSTNFTTDTGESFTAKQIVGHILAHVVDVAMTTAKQKLIEENLEGVVISVPAAFTNNEKEIIAQAASIPKAEGGPELKVLGFIKEPVAAALAYFEEPLANKKKILVYDLGGGTCDVAVVEANDSVDEKYTVIASEMERVGGKNWDERLGKYICDETEKQSGITITGNVAYEAKVKKAAIEAKHNFSKKTALGGYNERVRASLELEGRMYRVPITRDKFDELTHDLVDKTIALTKKVLSMDSCTDVDTIICVGGGSNMPQITNALAGAFPSMELKVYEPEKAIALGAAIFANTIDAGAIVDGDNVFLQDIASYSYGIRAHKGQDFEAKICNVILKGDKLPRTIRRTYYPHTDNQKIVSIKVFESSVEDEWCEVYDVPEEYILKVTLDLPENITKRDKIDVIMTLTNDGILEVSADDRHGNIKKCKKQLNI